MAAHMAQDALLNRLPSSACRECDRGLPKHMRERVNCRGTTSLNGQDAAAEMVRGLRARFRAQLLNGSA